MTDSESPFERFAMELVFEIAQLALGTPPMEPALFEGRYAGGVVASIFEALERVEEVPSNRLATEYADDPAHACLAPG
jgi:hypothetical protein